MKKTINIIIIILILLVGCGIFVREVIFPIKDKKIIEKYAKEYNVKPELIASIIHFETDFNQIPYNKGKACGLMKLTAKTGAELAKEIGEKNFKPEEIVNNDKNIQLGTYYLSKSNGKSLRDLVGNWSIRNGVEKDSKIDMKDYAEKFYTKKIENREKIYKVLYFMF
ncbi:transglycosylase SLT domain-containing protein [Clostridium thermobutyricum]|uniref:transglycosylase SLT domain-containing protein n=1 Tax=Clostridium thermobutyricum TaxID=29372 RepID=UPI002943F839|nr:transglycosylase SLT domain-containing protein [Clostridium thermobutyricum]